MENNKNIEFAVNLLKRIHISSHISENPDAFMSAEIDGGLREMLFGESDYSRLLSNSPREAKNNVVYRFFDEYMCRYTFFRIPYSRSDSYLFVGPYLCGLPRGDFILKKSEQLGLSDEQIDQLTVYYRHLPIVEDENIVFAIVDTLASELFGGESFFSIDHVSYEIPDKRRPVYNSAVFDGAQTSENKLTLEAVEENYKNENSLMDAVSKGKLNKVDFIASSIINKGSEQRISDSLRNRKNYLVILNTLLRKSAEYGSVHPYHIHVLSSLFAKKIEGLSSIEESFELQKNMIRKYCLLVKEYSLKKYSDLIGKVVTLISYDLTADLSLKNISLLLNINASYLSSAFRKETGETLTDYVNRKRMENAALILSHSDKQVQAVAEECGILDVNYFIKIFKKRYGMTPTQYRASIIK